MKREKMRGLGPKSLQCLNDIGITSLAQLRQRGAVAVYIALKIGDKCQPSLNMLYALEGAIENRDWRDVAKNERDRLLIELEAYEEMLNSR